MEQITMNEQSDQSINELALKVLSITSTVIDKSSFLSPLQEKLKGLVKSVHLNNQVSHNPLDNEVDYACIKELQSDFEYFKRHIETLCRIPDNVLANSAKMLWMIIEKHTSQWYQKRIYTLDGLNNLLKELSAEYNRTFIEATRLRGWLDRLQKQTDSINRNSPSEDTDNILKKDAESVTAKYLFLFINGLAIIEDTYSDGRLSDIFKAIDIEIRRFNANTVSGEYNCSELHTFAVVA